MQRLPIPDLPPRDRSRARASSTDGREEGARARALASPRVEGVDPGLPAAPGDPRRAGGSSAGAAGPSSRIAGRARRVSGDAAGSGRGRRASTRPGEILVAGRGFGSGPAREHAPPALLAAGVRCVIAASFEPDFFREAIEVGLFPLESPRAAAAIAEGDRVVVERDTGRIVDETTGERFRAQPVATFVLRVRDAGGLLEWARRERLGGDGPRADDRVQADAERAP